MNHKKRKHELIVDDSVLEKQGREFIDLSTQFLERYLTFILSKRFILRVLSCSDRDTTATLAQSPFLATFEGKIDFFLFVRLSGQQKVVCKQPWLDESNYSLPIESICDEVSKEEYAEKISQILNRYSRPQARALMKVLKSIDLEGSDRDALLLQFVSNDLKDENEQRTESELTNTQSPTIEEKVVELNHETVYVSGSIFRRLRSLMNRTS